MDAREQVREAIRAEVAKQNPVQDARHSLELIAETAVRFDGDGTAGYRVIDDHGDPRTKIENGQTVDFTIRDLVAELRDKHPTLFQSPPLDDPLGTPSESQGGPAPRHERDGVSADLGASTGEAASAEPASAQVDAAERAMPRAGPFEGNLSGASFDSPGAAPQDVAASGSPRPSDESRRGPRDWLILDGGKRDAETLASPSDASGPAAASSEARAPLGTGPAPAKSGPPTRPEPARALVAAGRTRSARRPATLAYAVLGGLAVLSTGAYLAAGSLGSGPDLLPKPASKQAELKPGEKARARTAAAPQPPADPVATGSVATSPAAEPTSARPGPVEPGPITGVPEVIDTATLRIDGKVVRLVGVEWARGGRADNLTSYLGGREVTCQPAEASTLFRCKVEGRDLSQVVLYNGGGRASPNAPADLLAAENYARTERIGVWQK